MAPARHKVVLCADDFGMTEGVSRGILELAQMGRLSATSAMTNCPWWPRLAPQLKGLEGRVGVGLHLTLTTGAPLGPMPRFAPRGVLPPFKEVLRGALTGRLPLDEIGAEITRQLDAFEDAFGSLPGFVDGHQHVHVLPGIRGALLTKLKERRASKLWLRDPSDELQAILHRRLAAKKALIVRALSAGFRASARSAGFDTNEGFSGFSPFDPAIDAAEVFEPAFRRLGGRPLVMCHPGYVDDELKRIDPVVGTRVQEFAYLSSGAFTELLRTRNMELTPFPGCING